MIFHLIRKSVLFVLFFFFGLPIAGAAEKTIIGAMESVLLLDWNIHLPARVDSGATKSSLGVENIKIIGGDVEARLPMKFGGKTLRMTVLKWRNYKTTVGQVRRPVVKIEICVGSERLMAEVNLADRAGMEFPFLLGRNILKNRFVVDVSEAYLLKPECPKR